MATKKESNLYLLRTARWKVFYVVANDPTEAQNLLINALREAYGGYSRITVTSIELVGKMFKEDTMRRGEENVFSKISLI